MTTRVYGISYDYVGFSGDITGQLQIPECDVLLWFSDGSLISFSFVVNNKRVGWNAKLIHPGPLYNRIERAADDGYSDTIYFDDGIKWAVALKSWGAVSGGVTPTSPRESGNDTSAAPDHHVVSVTYAGPPISRKVVCTTFDEVVTLIQQHLHFDHIKVQIERGVNGGGR
jgi:hypothetical protein